MKEHNFRTDVLPLSDKLFRLAVRITMVREDAEDMVQEALLRVWRTMQQGEEIENVEAFAVIACRNLCLDLMEKRQHRDTLFDPEQHESLASDPSPHEQMEAAEKYESISSQITKIRRIQNALRKASQFYVQLCKMGFGVEFVDCGGGLGVDYDGSRSANSESNFRYEPSLPR